MSAYIEGMNMSAPAVTSYVAALRGPLNWLVVKQVVPENPALFGKRPRSSRQLVFQTI